MNKSKLTEHVSFFGGTALAQMAEHFFGYGRWDVPYWFVGSEAGIAKSGDGLSLRYESWKQLGCAPVVDCEKHHRGFGMTKWHRHHPPTHTTWRQLILSLYNARMKRDMDLFREILLAAEEMPVSKQWTAQPLLDHPTEEVVAHMRLLKDAGYIDARFIGPTNNDTAILLRITNIGYEFLEASKQPSLWEKAKQQVKSVGAPLSLEILKMALDHGAKALLQ
jgi:hypothetical protein